MKGEWTKRIEMNVQQTWFHLLLDRRTDSHESVAQVTGHEEPIRREGLTSSTAQSCGGLVCHCDKIAQS